MGMESQLSGKSSKLFFPIQIKKSKTDQIVLFLFREVQLQNTYNTY